MLSGFFCRVVFGHSIDLYNLSVYKSNDQLLIINMIKPPAFNLSQLYIFKDISYFLYNL